MHADPRLYRAFTIISDTAIVIASLALVLGFLASSVNAPAWFLAGAIAGCVVIAARGAALRYRP